MATFIVLACRLLFNELPYKIFVETMEIKDSTGAQQEETILLMCKIIRILMYLLLDDLFGILIRFGSCPTREDVWLSFSCDCNNV